MGQRVGARQESLRQRVGMRKEAMAGRQGVTPCRPLWEGVGSACKKEGGGGSAYAHVHAESVGGGD